jgi:DNA-binding HxlR family transcriptional regulator
MAKRFDQYCPIAHALSLVGERWALLVVRELMKGPKRYTDIAAGLPGIGTNILATRLKDLEQAGIVVRRKLPPPAASTVYELTEYGAGLEEAMHALARWGARTLGPPGPDEEFEPDWGLNAFPALLNLELARGLTETYVLHAGEDLFTVRLVDGELSVEMGAAEESDLRMTAALATFFELASGGVDPRAVAERGDLEFDGDADALVRFFEIFSFAPRDAPGLRVRRSSAPAGFDERFSRPAAAG